MKSLSNKKKIMSIIGTRPQFIKLFAIFRSMEKFKKNNPDFIDHIIVNTGQHFDKLMSDVFISELKINKPNYNLGVKEDTQLTQVGKMILKLEEVLIEESPDIVLVYGDTNSTLAGALAAKKLNFKLAHIEAGLRSFNRSMQEEINRIVTDKVSDILFCPTENAIKNLKKEGFLLKESNYKVYNVGDVMYDTFLFFKEIALTKSKILDKIFGGEKKNYILATIHRAENTDNIDRLNKIIDLLNDVSRRRYIVFPIHPRTKNRIGFERLKRLDTNKIKIIEPVSYFDMLKLEGNANFIITDSGGVQKEAYFFNKICITLRKETEWVETLRGRCNFLVDLSCKKVMRILEMSTDKCIFSDRYYGDGSASTRIIEILTLISKEINIEKKSKKI